MLIQKISQRFLFYYKQVFDDENHENLLKIIGTQLNFYEFYRM